MEDKVVKVLDCEFENYRDDDVIFDKIPSIELALKLFSISRQLDIEIDSNLFFERSFMRKKDIRDVILEAYKYKNMRGN